MRFPRLVPDRVCNTQVEVQLYSEELNENGSKQSIKFSGKCNYQDQAKRVYTSEKMYVELTGVCLFNGDIAPNLANISNGKVTINGEDRTIFSGSKARNVDGTVNYTRLDLV